MIHVVCALRHSTTYDAQWAKNLSLGVRLHLSEEHTFTCFNNVYAHPFASAGIRWQPLQTEWPGWWCKVEIFKQMALVEDPVLYLDLDVLCTDELSPLVQRVPGFKMCDDFLNPGKGLNNSSVMSWRGNYSFIPDIFASRSKELQAKYHRTDDGRIGDQAYIEDVVRAAGQPVRNFAEGQVVSYRAAARQGPPPGASVVAFHGQPKPHQADGWAQIVWEDLCH